MQSSQVKPITITVKDNVTGETETLEVALDDYYLLTTGGCYVASTQAYPKSGTHVITVKGQRARRTNGTDSPG